MGNGPSQNIATSKWVTLRVTIKEYQGLKHEADSYGYQLSNLLRLRVFGKVNRVRNIERPPTDMSLLGDIIGKLTTISGELTKNGMNIQSIAERMSKSCGDAFGLDFCLRHLERLSQELLKALDLIGTTVTCHQKRPR